MLSTDARCRLEDLAAGRHVLGLDTAGPVRVVAASWHGDDAVTLTYRRGDGSVAEEVLDRSAEARLQLVDEQSRWTFDGDGAAFRLAAEALRLRMAALTSPMLAVGSSEIDPLPHQIRAVYSELLPRTPLRFLLADDPGAGKTVMAGLLAKELILRGDLRRCLVVAPGSLVEQWQEELETKFGLRFELLSRSMVDDAAGTGRSVFDGHPMLVARMDQLSRDDALLADLESSEWDLVVVDEAHRMSAHYASAAEVSTTRRYRLGQLLGGASRHLLLMTATPHAGKEDDFQLFLALLDPDRFEGRYRAGVHSADTSGLMLRRVKEQLLTFEGKPLFPERVAETVPYRLSPAEQDLYEQVTQYVRQEMNRADRLAAAGDGRRSTTVGFALTVLQRRLASSPEAIWRSLQRRRDRLQARRAEMLAVRASPLESRLVAALHDPESLDADLDDLPPSDLEELEDDVVDAATAAQTVAELDAEVVVLTHLAQRRRRGVHGFRVASALLVAALLAVVALPSATAVRYGLAQRSLLLTVFDDDEGTAAPAGATDEDPWAGTPRVNVLLVGADTGEDRTGTRPDTLILASINTATGDTVIFGLPRQLDDVPFPEGSAAAELWPEACEANGTGGCYLNAVYLFGTQHPELYPTADDPGLAATRDAVSAIVDLDVDHTAMVNLNGFQDLIDAMGGIRLVVERRIPIGGGERLNAAGRVVGTYPVTGYIEPGEQLLDGFQAEWYARSRWESNNNDRMDRQRCLVNAAVKQYSATDLARAFPRLAASAEQDVSTDIPASRLNAFIDLGLKVKEAPLRALSFTEPLVSTGSPDYDQIHQLVRDALVPPTASPTASPSPTGAVTATPAPSAGATDGVTSSPTETVPSGEAVSADSVCPS